MKKLSDFKGEAALDVLTELMDPFLSILDDKELKEMRKEHREKNESLPDDEKEPLPVYKLVKPILRNHKKEVIEILAILNEKPYEEFKDEINALQIPVALMTLLGDPEIKMLFQSQDQTQLTSEASSGPATETTEAEEN